MTRRWVPVLVAAASVFGSSGSLAAPIFTAVDEGDWFDPASWSGGAVPTLSDEPLIDNGATATASSASPNYPGAGAPIALQSLAVGSRLDPARPADASGAI
jgi:hypothetical protein